MKKYIITGAVATGLLVVGLVAYLGNQAQPADTEPTTRVTSSSSTVATENNQEESEEVAAEETKKGTDKSESSSSPVQKKNAVYQEYSPSAFEAAKGTTRILFFYDKAHDPSVKLDTVLKAQSGELPKGLQVFKVPYADEESFANSLSVTEPGVVLKYDKKDTLTGIYIAIGTPDMVTFRKALNIDAAQ